MENNKQHNPIDWISNQFYELLEQYSEGHFDRSTFNELMLAMTYKAREMYQDKMEAAIIKQCATQSTSQASKYAEGYKEGYKRACDYMIDTIKNKVEVMENANNEFRKGTANTTHTTFLCTQFVSDQLFYKGTLPHCMRCGKPQYQHPIISNTQ
jgi:chlorite dismutase